MKKIGLISILIIAITFMLQACGDKPLEEKSEAFSPKQFEQLIKDNETVIIDFKADWCGPCKILGPSLEKVAEEYKGKIKLQKIDVDLSPELSTQMGIEGIPYVVKYVKGKKVNEMVGLVPEEEVRKFFAE